MRRAMLSVGLLLVVSSASAQSFRDAESLALSGDYQAQRNIAFGFASSPMPGQARDPVKACAWYLLVLRSDSVRLNVGDVGNVLTYCDKLDMAVRLQAERQANTLYRRIYGSAAK